VLRVVEVAAPHAGTEQVRVAVRAAGVNYYDTKVRNGSIPSEFPRGQGNEFAGVIDEIGADVVGLGSDLAVGDEVLGWTMAAAQAEHVVVPAKHVARKPAGLDWAIAGGLGLVANTAWRAVSALQIESGDTVLVTGVAGGVGLLGAQFALQAGALVVGTASESNHEFLRDLGIIPVSYGPGVSDRLRAAAPDGYTAALDTVGRAEIEHALSLGIRPQRINSVAYHPGADEFGISVVGGGKKSAEELARFAQAAADGAITLPILATYPLTAVRAAYERLERRHGLGKIVLTVP
jgi:NADPH:quinone reductase-like Zn-dependent oxidoreductase